MFPNLIRPAGFASSGGGQRNAALSNAISYAALNNADYSYYDSVDQMPQLYDGDLSKGMMGLPLDGMVFVQVQLSASSFLNKITLYLGQFTGAVNMPDAIKIYSGLVTPSTTDTPIYSGSLAATGSAQDVDLTAVTALNSPFTQITIALIRVGQGYSTVAANEMQLKGHSA